MIIRLTESDLIRIVKKVINEGTTGASVKNRLKTYGFIYGFPYDYFLIGRSDNPNAYTAEELSTLKLEIETQGEGQRYSDADQKAEFVVYIKPTKDNQNWDSYISLSKINFNNKQANTLRNLFLNLRFDDKEKHRYTFEGILPIDKVFQFVDYLRSYHNVTGQSNRDITDTA